LGFLAVHHPSQFSHFFFRANTRHTPRHLALDLLQRPTGGLKKMRVSSDKEPAWFARGRSVGFPWVEAPSEIAQKVMARSPANDEPDRSCPPVATPITRAPLASVTSTGWRVDGTLSGLSFEDCGKQARRQKEPHASLPPKNEPPGAPHLSLSRTSLERERAEPARWVDRIEEV